jgi:low temperature requirement protein LtrA
MSCDGPIQGALWLIALAVDYVGALLGRGQGWRVSPAHFAERHGLIVIIALGESLIAIGVGAAGELLTAGVVTTAVLGIVVIAALWWAYFDVMAVIAQRQLSQTSGATRVRLARDCYSYLHLPMIAGIVLFALGLKKTVEHVGDPLATIPAVALCGGLSLYFFTHVALRVRIVHFIRKRTTETPGWIGPGRLAAGIAMLALIPAALELPALTALALAAGVCCALIAWDVLTTANTAPRSEKLGPSELSEAEQSQRPARAGASARSGARSISPRGASGWMQTWSAPAAR